MNDMANVAEWWPKISDASREWLVAHPREELPDTVWKDVVRAGGGTTTADAEEGRPMYSLPDADWDTIERYSEEK
jgi:hypothetical protein